MLRFSQRRSSDDGCSFPQNSVSTTAGHLCAVRNASVGHAHSFHPRTSFNGCLKSPFKLPHALKQNVAREWTRARQFPGLMNSPHHGISCSRSPALRGIFGSSWKHKIHGAPAGVWLVPRMSDRASDAKWISSYTEIKDSTDCDIHLPNLQNQTSIFQQIVQYVQNQNKNWILPSRRKRNTVTATSRTESK